MKISREEQLAHRDQVVAILKERMEKAKKEYQLAAALYESAKTTGGLL